MKRLRDAIVHSVKMLPLLGCATMKYLASWFISGEFSFRIKGYDYPVLLRGRTSDVKCMYRIFRCGEYAAQDVKNAEWIVDAGANVGYASIYLLNQHPCARVIALEPELSNYEMLVRNTRYYPVIQTLRLALAGTDGMVWKVNEGAEKWAYRFSNSAMGKEEGVPSISLSSLLSRYGIDVIDVLKMDIEGGEEEVFMMRHDWLARVRCLMLEIHRGCWKSVFNALNEFDYDARISGENMIVMLCDNERTG